MCLPPAALDDPLQNAHVLPESGPRKLAVRVGSKPVDIEYARRRLDRLPHRQPMGEIVADVVAAKRQHGKGIAAHLADFPRRSRGRLRAHRRRLVDAFFPAGRFDHQRHRVAAPRAENKRRNRHAVGVVPLGIERRAARCRDREPRVGVRRLAPAPRAPRLALPVGEMRRRLLGHAFPPDVAIIGERDIGKDHVALERLHRVGIRFVRRPGSNAEVSGFRIDRVKPAVGMGLDPRDIVPDSRDLPSVEAVRRNEHREIRLAASAGESGAYISFVSVGRGDAEDQHVLREPSLIAAHHRGDSQGKAFLAEKRVAAVSRAIAPDLPGLRKMHDVFVLCVAWPRDIALS